MLRQLKEIFQELLQASKHKSHAPNISPSLPSGDRNDPQRTRKRALMAPSWAVTKWSLASTPTTMLPLNEQSLKIRQPFHRLKEQVIVY